MSHDTIIVGAGLAGCAAAIGLSSKGQRVVLIDREREVVHKVCGEFLSGPAIEQLAKLGVDPFALGGVPIKGVRIASRNRSVEAPLPFLACGLSRLRLDTAMRREAAHAGAEMRLGEPVRSLDHGEAVLANGSALCANHVILATGKHDLPQQRRRGPGKRTFVGFKLHVRLVDEQHDALGHFIELHLFDGGYVGIQRIEEDLVNLSFVIDDFAFARAGRSFSGALDAAIRGSGLLACRLSSHTPAWSKPLAIANIPYGYRAWRAPDTHDKVWRVGDQAAVIPSFTGDGMAMALTSGLLAADCIIKGETSDRLQAAIRLGSQRQFAASQVIASVMRWPSGVQMTIATMSQFPQLATLFARMTRVQLQN